MTAIVAVALLSAAGCAASVPPDSPPGRSTPGPSTPSPVSVSVSVVQSRSDVSVGRMQLRVTNDGRDALAVRRATLESEALSAAAAWDKGTTIPAGGTRDLPVRFPGGNCTAEPEDAVVRLDVEHAEIPVVRVPAADPHGRIPALADADCFSRELAAAGTLRLGELGVGEAACPAELELRAESAVGSTGFTVASMASTVLFSTLDSDGAPRSAAPIGLVLGPGAAPMTARVPIRPARCDPHALAEDKVGTVFRFSVEIHGGRSGTVALPAPPALRAQLSEYFLLSCGL